MLRMIHHFLKRALPRILACAQRKYLLCLSPPPSQQVPKEHLWNVGLRHTQGAAGLENQPHIRPGRGLLCIRYQQQDYASGYRTGCCWPLLSTELLSKGHCAICHVPASRLFWLNEHIGETSKYPLNLPATPGKERNSSKPV